MDQSCLLTCLVLGLSGYAWGCGESSSASCVQRVISIDASAGDLSGRLIEVDFIGIT